MPVDWKTPSGYLISFAIEFVAAYYVAISCTCNVSFPVGACCFLIAFADDIKEELRLLDQYSKSDEKCSIGFYQKFRNLIEFHSIAKQLSFQINTILEFSIRRKNLIFRFAPNFSDTFKLIHTFYFLWTVLTICDTLLMFQMELVEYFRCSFSQMIINFFEENSLLFLIETRGSKYESVATINFSHILVIRSNLRIL